MSEIETTAKKRGRKAVDKAISGKVNRDDFTSSMGDIQKDSMVSQEKISELLVKSMEQAYLEWAYPGLYKDKDGSFEDDLTKSLIKCHITFEDDLSKFHIYDVKVITPDDEIYDDAWQISPEDYYDLTKKDAEDGTTVEIPFDVTNLDKSYVRRVKQLFQSKLKEASRDAILTAYKDQMHKLIYGTIVRADQENGEYEVSFGKSSAYLKSRARKLLDNDRFSQGERICFYLDKVNENTNPPSLDVNRTSPQFIEKLIEREVPEVKEGIVLIKGIARVPSKRTKVFVASKDPNIDPVGTCIGPEASRQRNILNELRGEKVDICLYHKNKALQIIEAMKPADVIGITCPDDFFNPEIDFAEIEKSRDYIHPQITVIVNNGAQGIAIGSFGSNVRSASMLTKCKLTVLEIDEAMKNGIKCLMTPEIIKAARAIDPSEIKEEVKVVEPLDDEDNFEEEEVLDEEVKAVEPETVEKEEKVEESTENESAEESGKPVKEEEVEHIEIMNKPTISLESLEAALTLKKGPSETRAYKKKKKVEQKEEKNEPSLASQSQAMPIYTEEELQALDDQQQDEEYEYDDDVEQYDEYYTEDK